ncbi:hypothetical protein D3P04_01320 [Paracoccus onubensis]|uniref:2Fe-2S iron-sulfur cluster binding domain-containing protein n=2 Tax=Paracoccus onubensis TaxID=1675788 RepID=A0A418T7V9_9RHOB|nr:hypothetical protein D3P04_01320 [Paracoccus onubensis]
MPQAAVKMTGTGKPDMDSDTREFINNATLLFIASRNAEGALDVSPRGGQPSVMRVSDSGALLLPDYKGNRRLDTIGNLLSNPEIAMIVVNRGVDRYLRISGRGEVSFRDSDIAAFPADENPPISVLVLTPARCEFVETTAFRNAGFWLGSAIRKAPLDLGAVVRGDKLAQADAGFSPVRKHAGEEQLLTSHGMREVYGSSSEAVQTKVFDIAGPGGLAFMEEARFIVLSHENAQGGMEIDLTGAAPLSVIPFDNRQAYRLHLPPDLATTEEGECALVTIAPGRNEMLRVNGRFEKEPARNDQSLKIVPREVYFHCPASLSRARIWQDDRRVYWAGRRRFICVDRRRESPDVVSFVLEPRDDAPIGPIGPGQYVTVSLPDDAEAVARRRSYSVSGRPDGNSLRISVRRMGNGGLSDLLHDSVHAGSELLVGIPAGRFVLDSPPGRRVALISAGVGITPLLPMLERLAQEESGREVWFLHAARDAAHHLFPDEVCEIAKRPVNGGIRLFWAYSRPREGDACDLGKRLDAATVAGIMPVADTDFYICGPQAFMQGLREGLVALGAAPENIRFEEFSAQAGTAFDLGDKEITAECKVTFAQSGKTATWTPAAGSLLDLALSNQVKVAYSCRIGDCQSCLQRVLEGAADYPAGELPVLAQGQILLCQAIPRGDMIIDC